MRLTLPTLVLTTTTGSILAALGMLFPFFWPLAPFGLATFFYGLWCNKTRFWPSVASGFAFGLTTGAASIWWFWDTLPIDWLGIFDPSVQYLAVGATWLYISLGFGIAVALVSPLIRSAGKSAFAPLLAGVFWILAEELRMWSFALLTWAPESLLGAHFSSASLGYALTESGHFLRLAYPLGVLGLNGATGVFAGGFAALAYALPAHRFPRAGILIAPLLILLVIPLFLAAPLASGPKLRVALLSTSMPAGAASYPEARALMDEALSADVDILAFPENVTPLRVYGSEDVAREALGKTNALVLHTEDALGGASTPSKKLVYEHQGARLGDYDKLFLMPLGEYVPAFSSIFYAPFADSYLHRYLNKADGALSRGERVNAVEYRDARIGGLLCSEILSPLLYRSLVRTERATLLVNIANDSWFHSSRLLETRLRQAAKTHAVALRTPLIVAGNDMPSFVIDPAGRVVVEGVWGNDEVLYASVRTSQELTP